MNTSRDKDRVENETSEISILQLSDSFFPIGTYSMSSGLEALYYEKSIKGQDNVRDLIRVFLENQVGPADCNALGNSIDYARKSMIDNVIEVDRLLYSMKLVQEIRNAATKSGTQMLRCVWSFIHDEDNAMVIGLYKNAVDKGEASGIYPVVLGIAANALGIEKKKAGIMMLYSFSTSIIAASIRLGMIQHFEGQKIIHQLKPVIREVVKNYVDRPLEDIWQFAPLIDIIQMHHEMMSSKMFIT